MISKNVFKLSALVLRYMLSAGEHGYLWLIVLEFSTMLHTN